MKKQGSLQDVNVIRSLAIIIVVAFHAYGMMYAANHFPESADLYRELYFGIAQCGPINFAMPLFVIISGYLFAYLLGTGRYADWKQFVWNKFKRLLIPYWIFCSLMMLTNGFFDIKALVFGAYSHLWFLTMLFWCFILCYLLHRITRSMPRRAIFEVVVLAGSFFLIQIEKQPSFLNIMSLPVWFFWFYLGYCLMPYKDRVIEAITKYWLHLILLALYLIIAFNVEMEYGKNSLLIDLGRLSSALLVWYLINMLLKLGNGKWATTRFFVEMGGCSYGIYIFHNWVQPYMISKTAQHVFPLAQWAVDHTILFPLGFFLLSLAISYVLTKVLLATRVGRFLIG